MRLAVVTAVQYGKHWDDLIIISHATRMDDQDKALLICLEDEESSEDDRSEESDIFRSRTIEGAL